METKYLLCYEIGLNPSGLLGGHTFATIDALTEDNLEKLASEILTYFKNSHPELYLGKVIWRSVIKLEG